MHLLLQRASSPLKASRSGRRAIRLLRALHPTARRTRLLAAAGAAAGAALAAAAEGLAEGAAVEEEKVDDSRKETRVVTNPSANAVFDVSMTVKVYDFRTPPETEDSSKSKKKKKGRR